SSWTWARGRPVEARAGTHGWPWKGKWSKTMPHKSAAGLNPRTGYSPDAGRVGGKSVNPHVRTFSRAWRKGIENYRDRGISFYVFTSNPCHYRAITRTRGAADYCATFATNPAVRVPALAGTVIGGAS